jgi:hypothetical protein
MHHPVSPMMIDNYGALVAEGKLTQCQFVCHKSQQIILGFKAGLHYV